MTNAGRPTWIDLATHDIEGAHSFYAEMFGWEFLDQGPDFGGYEMASVSGGMVAGAMSSFVTESGLADEPQMPTSWTVYLTVDDIHAAIAKVPAAGGSVMVPAMQIADAGWMAVVIDPAGAVVGMWQPLEFAGFEFTGKPGTPVWFETMSMDYDAAAAFYTEVFGWDLVVMGDIPEGQPRYATNGANGAGGAGIFEAANFIPAEVGSYWRMYLQVSDVDAACERIVELGGKVLDGPIDSPFGRLATVADPQGAGFQIITN